MRKLLTTLAILSGFILFAQDLDLLSDDLIEIEEEQDYATATFKTNRIINGHSIETVSKNEMDLKFSHRFGFLSDGPYTLFGLDQASVRIGADYGITDHINVGIGRSTVEKTYDGFVKYRFLRQQTGPERNVPITATWLSAMGVNTLKFADPNRKNYFTSRLHYTHQLLIARKFSSSLSIQISPGIVHKNLVDSTKHKNDIYFISGGVRQKLTKRTSVNLEYFYVFPNQLPSERFNCLSVGFDIETGGHVFQLFFTNATGPFEKSFITDTNSSWMDGNVRFGFNIARIFNF